MAFSERIKDAAFVRSGGRCECRRLHRGMAAPHHGARCSATFTRHGHWEANHKTAVRSDGPDSLSNCEVLCEPCHVLTRTYGEHD